jgi:Protein of unknown function (DUF2934)
VLEGDIGMTDGLRSRADSRLPDDDNSSTVTSFSIDPDPVARRAYDRSRVRGANHGRDQEDWFEAERELIAAQLEEA